MSYQALVSRSVALAFKAVGDLAKRGTLTKAGSRSFNFSTMQPVIALTAPLSVLAVITESKKKETTSLSVMFRAAQSGDVNLYDTLQLEGKTYKLVHPINQYGGVNICDVEAV